MNIYEAIYSRRDVRSFRPDPVPDQVLLKILDAAHHAGSVGFMQPWNFIIIRDPQIKRQVHDNFNEQDHRAAENYEGSRRELYTSLKLAGILDAPLNLAVTCDHHRGGPHVLGRNTVPDTDVYSTCCAIQNLWLAARAEGVGVGWVSILDHDVVKRILKIPQEVLLVAYLCIGYPQHFDDQPMLQQAGWRERLSLEDVVSQDSWKQPLCPGADDRRTFRHV